jgi:hypothetical protein
MKASLTLSQSNGRGGTQQELALDCGTVTRVDLELAGGMVSARAFRMTTERGSTAVAAFWMVPAS